MKTRKASLAIINSDLARAARSLNHTAARIRHAGLAPRRNIRRVGEALISIFAIQGEIYRARPDRLPTFLTDTEIGRKVLSNKRVERTAAKRSRKPGRRSRGRSTASR